MHRHLICNQGDTTEQQDKDNLQQMMQDNQESQGNNYMEHTTLQYTQELTLGGLMPYFLCETARCKAFGRKKRREHDLRARKGFFKILFSYT